MADPIYDRLAEYRKARAGYLQNKAGGISAASSAGVAGESAQAVRSLLYDKEGGLKAEDEAERARLAAAASAAQKAADARAGDVRKGQLDAAKIGVDTARQSIDAALEAWSKMIAQDTSASSSFKQQQIQAISTMRGQNLDAAKTAYAPEETERAMMAVREVYKRISPTPGELPMDENGNLLPGAIQKAQMDLSPAGQEKIAEAIASLTANLGPNETKIAIDRINADTGINLGQSLSKLAAHNTKGYGEDFSGMLKEVGNTRDEIMGLSGGDTQKSTGATFQRTLDKYQQGYSEEKNALATRGNMFEYLGQAKQMYDKMSKMGFGTATMTRTKELLDVIDKLTKADEDPMGAKEAMKRVMELANDPGKSAYTPEEKAALDEANAGLAKPKFETSEERMDRVKTSIMADPNFATFMTERQIPAANKEYAFRLLLQEQKRQMKASKQDARAGAIATREKGDAGILDNVDAPQVADKQVNDEINFESTVAPPREINGPEDIKFGDPKEISSPADINFEPTTNPADDQAANVAPANITAIRKAALLRDLGRTQA